MRSKLFDINLPFDDEEAPLPIAGSGVFRRLLDTVQRSVFRIGLLCGVAVGFLVVGALASTASLLGTASPVIGITMVVVGASAFVAMIVAGQTALRRTEPLLKGFLGERYVGERLAELRANGYRAFHALEDSRGDIDHLLVGPGGLVVVETKIRNKPPNAKGKPRISVRDREIVFSHGPVDRDVIPQVEAQIRSVRRMLGSIPGLKNPPIAGAVLFPGWWVEEQHESQIYVANAKRIFAIVRELPPALDESQIDVIAKNIAILQWRQRTS